MRRTSEFTDAVLWIAAAAAVLVVAVVVDIGGWFVR